MMATAIAAAFGAYSIAVAPARFLLRLPDAGLETAQWKALLMAERRAVG